MRYSFGVLLSLSWALAVCAQEEPQVVMLRGAQGPPGEQGPMGEPGPALRPDAVGLFADRDDYDDEEEGFLFLATDGDGTEDSPAHLYFRTGAAGNWSAPVQFPPDDKIINVLSLGCQMGPAPSANNAELLSAALADPLRKNTTFVIPPGWFVITEPIVWPARNGFALRGAGFEQQETDSHYNADSGVGGGSTRIVCQFDGVSFNGTTVTASVTGVDDWIELDGHNVSPDDAPTTDGGETVYRRRVFIFSDGTGNWLRGTYKVIAVDTENNRWQLDRDCSSGSASGMIGWSIAEDDDDIQPAIKYQGRNGVIENLSLCASFRHSTNSVWGRAPKPRVGIHVCTSDVSGMPTGKLKIENVAINFFTKGILVGSTLVDEGGAAHPDEPDDHADHLRADNLVIRFIDNPPDPQSLSTAIHWRNEEAVDNVITKLRLIGSPAHVFWFEGGGGKTFIDGVSFGGEDNCLVRYSSSGGSNSSWIEVRGFSADGGTAGDWKLLWMDRSRPLVSHFRFSGVCGSGTASSGVPVFDLRGGCHLHVEDVYVLSAGCLRMESAVSDGVPRQIYACFDNCTFSTSVANVSDIVHADSKENAVSAECRWLVDWRGCTQTGGGSAENRAWGKFYADGRYKQEFQPWSNLKITALGEGEHLPGTTTDPEP